MENRTIRITEIDNQYYVKLADVDRLLHDMRAEIRDNAAKETLENGKVRYVFNDMELGRINDLFFVSSCLRRRLVVTCETPEEIRQLHERIRHDFFVGKWYLSEKVTGEDGKDTLVYFRKYCPGAMEARLKAEGRTQEEIDAALEEKEGDPAFTEEDKYIHLFESMEEADSNRIYINHNYHTALEVHPAWMLDRKGAKKLLDALLKGDDADPGDRSAD